MATAVVTIPKKKRPWPVAGSVAGRSSARELFEKPIDNSHLHREPDPQKNRQCFALMGMVGLAFIFILVLAVAHFRCVRYGYQIERLKAQQADLAVWNRRLRLEQALLSDPQRIDRLARNDLGLAPPQPQQVVHLGGTGVQASMPSAPVVAHNFGSLAPARRSIPRDP
jgi:cell division protein FtsL